MSYTISSSGSPSERAEEYLQHAPKFQLGDLLTEKSHPQTRELSDWAKKDLEKGISALKRVDIDAIQALEASAEKLTELKNAIEMTLSQGKRIYLCGCGATGRLSLTLEFLWRQENHKNPQRADQVRGFMAGGDVALIRSIESFEDHFEFGERQLTELGFEDGDLVIGVTEGGETSFVIGATEYAAEHSSNSPFFLFCNPQELLAEKVDRSRRVIEDNRIKKICLASAPMSLSGSTRMQASTVLLLAVGSCLFSGESTPKDLIRSFASELESCEWHFIKEFTELETKLYNEEKCLVYCTDEFGMTILTDTTERSPTFSLAPFENFDEKRKEFSLCYFNMKDTQSAAQAWEKLLLRPPRTLKWDQYEHIAGPQKIAGYDFSDQVFSKRKDFSQKDQVPFEISWSSDQVVMRLQNLEHRFDWKGMSLLNQHLLLKVILNTHSTLVMGRLDRYEGNWMTWVKPSNGKLVDRSIRYVLGLAEQKGLSVTYEEVAHQVFEEMTDLGVNQAIVLKTLNSLLANRKS